MQRRFHRYQPLALLAVFAVLVGVPLFLDLFISPVRGWIEGQAHDHAVAINLLEHLLVAALVASAAFYWVLGRRRQKALNSYRLRACDEPWELVQWSQTKAPLVRQAMSKLVTDGIERSQDAAVAVVQGRAGTGRTSFLVGLVRDLAQRNFIPIPVLVGRDGSFEPEDLARENFCHHIDPLLMSDREADEIWHRARATRDIVILVDGLDEEVVAALWRDEGRAFQATIESLRSRRIAVVLATTTELPLGEVKPLREDLDLFSREEAERYLQQALGAAPADDAMGALKRLHDPVDDVLLAPFYLELITRMQRAGVSLGEVPGYRDRWRAAVLGAYLQGIRTGKIVPLAMSVDSDASDSRGLAALDIVNELAISLQRQPDQLTAPLNGSGFNGQALADAVNLNLLWHGVERVGFAADDLGAYLVATTLDKPSLLLEQVWQIAESPHPHHRRDRHVLTTLIFWHLQHDDTQRLASFDTLLGNVESRNWTRPAVIAAVVRIASACNFTKCNKRVAAAVKRCVDALDTDQDQDAQPWHANELLRLVRALAEWPTPVANRLLWRLATNRNIEVEWPAAKALATANNKLGKALRHVIQDTLERAETHPPAELSEPASDLGNRIASLAWILPALRGANDLAEQQLARVTKLCLAHTMSPLRGEMSLAQGLKFAIVNDKMPVQNVEDVRKLLFEREGGVRFWHARLVLVHAMLAYSWRHCEDADRIDRQLAVLASRESQPLVKRGIQLARQGLLEARQSSNGDYPFSTYMWIHERSAVRWVEQGQAHVAQLAADTVLLSNMTYRLRKVDAPRADRVAALPELPRCIRQSSQRKNITNSCDCLHGLCLRPEDPAVIATRARFSESFCREQARLVAQRGSPSWVKRGIVDAYGRNRRLEEFWDRQAQIAQNGSSPTNSNAE